MTGKEVLKLIKQIYENHEVFESIALLKILYECKDVKRIEVHSNRVGNAMFNNIPTFMIELVIKVKPASDVECKNHRFNLWLRYYNEEHLTTIYQLWCHTYVDGPQSSDIYMNINTGASEFLYTGADLPEPMIDRKSVV